MGALFGELGASDHSCRGMAALGVQVRKAAASRFGRLSLTWTWGALGSGPTRSVHWTLANPGLAYCFSQIRQKRSEG